MEQQIICHNGMCKDIDNLDCEEKFENIIRVIECELSKE